MLRSKAASILLIVFVALVALVVIGQFLGIPIGLSYVETGSMEPTLNAGDGFVSLPPFLVGGVSDGDVITFNAQEVGGGGLTTHRVVDVTPEGYITRGDANPFTDQDGDEPPVTDAQVSGVAMELGGDVIRIPALGTVIMGIQSALEGVVGGIAAIPIIGQLTEVSVGAVMTAIGGVILFISLAWDTTTGNSRRRERTRSREGVVKFSVVLLILLALVLVPLNAAMLLPSGTMDTTITSSNSPSDDPTSIGVGESEEFEFEISNSGFMPRVVVIEPASEGVSVSPEKTQIFHGELRETTVTMSAPDETGAYIRSISERHYPLILPLSVIGFFHDIHPWVAILGLNLFVVTIVTTVLLVMFGLQPLRLRSTGRNVSLVSRVKRYLR